MAKYTANDPDILKLDKDEREDYNIFLSQYDVDKYQDIKNLIMNPKSIKLYRIEQIIQLLLLIPILVIIFLIIGNIIIIAIQYKLHYFHKNPTNNKYLIGCGLLIILLIILLLCFQRLV